jgi:hypothetical protein
MGFCNHCQVYYKKLPAKEICKACKSELCGTPPTMNSSFVQCYHQMKKKEADTIKDQTYRAQATLLDFASDSMISSIPTIIQLTYIMPEGHPPWYALLKAWYRKHKIKAKLVQSEKTPKKRLLKLLNVTLV